MDDTNNKDITNTPVGNTNSLPTSHPPTVPLPGSSTVKPVEPVTPIPEAVTYKDMPKVVEEKSIDLQPSTSENKVASAEYDDMVSKEVKQYAPEPIINSLSDNSATESSQPDLESNSSVSQTDSVYTEIPEPLPQPEVREPELVGSSIPVAPSPVVPPVVSQDPIMVSGPAKKSRSLKLVFKYLSLVLGGLLFIGIVLAGYVFLKDMADPEQVPITEPTIIIEEPEVVKPPVDNTSLDALENYFGNIGRELKILEDKTSFEAVMNLSGTELR